jgi:hypothetical protein
VNLRRILLALGVGTGVAGLVLAAFPGLAVGMGAHSIFVLVVGAFAGMEALLDVQARRRTKPTQAETGDPEAGLVPERAGVEIDEALAVAEHGLDRYTRERRDAIRDRVRSAAVEVLTRREECTPEEASAMLQQGSWTDDPYAAAFFGANADENLPWRVRVRDAIRPESRFGRRASHAIAAIVERAER